MSYSCLFHFCSVRRSFLWQRMLAFFLAERLGLLIQMLPSAWLFTDKLYPRKIWSANANRRYEHPDWTRWSSHLQSPEICRLSNGKPPVSKLCSLDQKAMHIFWSDNQEIEPFIETCRHASRRLLEAIQELKLLDNCVCQCKAGPVNGLHPHVFTAAHYSVMIQAQKKMMQSIFEDRHLLKLQTTGDAMLLKFQQDQTSHREAK